MRRVELLVFVLATSGCTIGETDVLAGSGDTQDGGLPDVQVEAEASTFDGGMDLSGTWAQLLVYGTVFNLPAIGQTEGTTTTVLHVSITEAGDTPQVVSKTCSVVIDNGTDIVETVIPNRFVDTLTVQMPETTARMEGGVWSYQQARELTLRGVRLNDPDTEPLPTDASDPRVFDQDEDGNPGMTVLIKGLTDGEVYVIQRDWYALDGAATGTDWIDGLATWNTEQVVLGSDNEILDAQTESSPHPDASRSYFRMTRVEDEADCESILERQDTLFERGEGGE